MNPILRSPCSPRLIILLGVISLISELNFLQIESAAVSEICWETIICMRVARVGSRYRSLGSPIFKINSLK